MPINENEDLNNNDKNEKFFMKFMDFIEHLSFKTIKEYMAKTKEVKEKAKEKENILKKTATTKEDKQKEKSKNVRSALVKFLLLAVVIMLLSSAAILAYKYNSIKPRPHIESKHILSTTTTFGKIGQENYFMRQHVLNDKINMIQKHDQKGFKTLQTKMNEQTSLLSQTIKNSIKQVKQFTSKKITKVKQSLQNDIKKQVAQLSKKQQQLVKQLHHIKTHKTYTHLVLTKNGKVVVFPKNIHRDSLFGGNSYKQTTTATTKNINNTPIVIKPKYKLVQVTQNINIRNISKLSINTLSQLSKKHKFKPFYVDLPIALTRVTLLTGCKAPTLSLGEANPVPVLMSIQGNVYLANNYVTDLRGCFLRGAAYGNINTSRAMIFGTHLSCILVARNGKKYKIEKTFPKGQVWIKGEDGNDGVQGLLVSSDGKILSKAAAMGFMQGFANYFAMQSVPVSPLFNTSVTGGTRPNSSALGGTTIGGSFQNGLGTAMSKSFNIIIKQYEKLLNGYYPYIDVKGGRPNLTAFFGGHMRLKVTPFTDPNIQKMEDNNFALGYKTNSKLSSNHKQGL